MLLPFLLIGQEDAESLLKQGVKFHDDGEFAKAIEYYEKAALLEPNNSTIDYEMALSYAGLKDYVKAIILSDKVIAKKDKNLSQAYLVKASAFDMLGRAVESTAILEEAIAVTKGQKERDRNIGATNGGKELNLARTSCCEVRSLLALPKGALAGRRCRWSVGGESRRWRDGDNNIPHQVMTY